MKPEEFVLEFEGCHFPSDLGPEISLDAHDPPFKKKELREMAKLGLIVLNEKDWTYRLTQKAAELRQPETERERHRFQNALRDLVDTRKYLDANPDNLSDDERKARNLLIAVCYTIADAFPEKEKRIDV
ncbi:hypothetical protein HW932_21095 [Allochromatium humboldtianum]|uniref:Uncharacterized protein n=1 Tax=Allochromatium humboldtianum TaxID=504901 RepID=A0A850RJR6_9GAMM|nr:hypothetical protein [Allochromatium humboldtianum]NVZ11747.1 hypothetical protein [Allochromatium humboldtianum]